MIATAEKQDIQVDSEFQELIPRLSREERTGLEADLIANGCRIPLDVWNETLIDGHNRYEICQQHDIPFETNTVELADRTEALRWIINNQLNRRNLQAIDRIALVEKQQSLKDSIREKNKERMLSGKADPTPNSAEGKESRDQIAALAGVGRDTYRKGVEILEKATPEVIDQIRRGEKSINKAHIEIVGPARSQDLNEFDRAVLAGKLYSELIASAAKDERLHEKLKKLDAELDEECKKSHPWPSDWVYDYKTHRESSCVLYENKDFLRWAGLDKYITDPFAMIAIAKVFNQMPDKEISKSMDELTIEEKIKQFHLFRLKATIRIGEIFGSIPKEKLNNFCEWTQPGGWDFSKLPDGANFCDTCELGILFWAGLPYLDDDAKK